MADSRIEEVQAKVTELESQYQRALSEYEAAQRAVNENNSDENALDLANAKKEMNIYQQDLEEARQEAEEVRQTVLLEVVESELDKAEKDLASKNEELEEFEQAEEDTPGYMPITESGKTLYDYRRATEEAEVIRDLWKAKLEYEVAKENLRKLKINPYSSLLPRFVPTEELNAAREAEKSSKELLAKAKDKYKKLTGQDYQIDEIISQAIDGPEQPTEERDTQTENPAEVPTSEEQSSKVTNEENKAQDNLKRVMGNKASRSASADVQKDLKKESDDLFNRSKEDIRKRAQEAKEATKIEKPSFTRKPNGQSIEDASKRDASKRIERMVEEYNKGSKERTQGFQKSTEKLIGRIKSLEVSYPKYIKKDTPEMIATREKIAEAEKKLRQAQQNLKKVEKRIESIGKDSFLFTPDVKQSLEDAKKQVKVHEVAVGKLKYELRQLESAQVMRWLEEIKKINGEVTSSRNQREEGAEGNTKSSEEPSNTPPSEAEVLPFMKKNAKGRNRVTSIKDNIRQRWRAG